MNRNLMYHYLKEEVGMYPVFNHIDRKSYYTEFRLQPNQTPIHILTDWGYIKGFSSIALCVNEVVIMSMYENTRIFIEYKSIKRFEVVIEEQE